MEYNPFQPQDQTRGVTGKFFWGGKVIFPDFFPCVKCFFPVENFHFGSPKTNVCRFEKWKAKKKTAFSNFPSFHFQFSTFSFNFPLFHFFLASFFLVGQQKFPNQKSLGDTLPPACYATGSNQFLRLWMPKNLRTWMILYFFCIRI